MKTSIGVFIISILAVIGCIGQENPKNSVIAGQIKNDADLLDFYRQYSTYTDPGDYEYLYKNLPESLSELCGLVKSQTIHPYGELPNYQNIIPQERWDEFYRYPTVHSILKGLLAYDSRGLIKGRKIQNRLVLGCRENSLLLASILKYRGIPARLRYGHAPYLIPGFHASHVICEVWNENDKRWMLVDPTVNRVDFSRDQFDFSNDAWLKMQQKEINPDLYGFPGQYSGLISIAAKVCHDLAALLGTEYTILQYAPLLDDAIKYGQELTLTSEQIETLNRISELMKLIDADNISALQDIYNNTPDIQITMSMEPIETNIDNDSRFKESSRLNNYSLCQNYPNPFNPNTKIKFSIPVEGNVKIIIYNTLGETVKTLMNDVLPKGTHVIEFNAIELPSGVYYLCLEAGDFRQVKKMTYLQ